MTRQASSVASAPTADQQFAAILEQLTARLQAGEPIDIDQLTADHPEHAERLRQLLPAMQLLADASRPDGPPLSAPIGDGLADEVTGPLGDFRLIREVGRGGMGIVYEAEQISLSRRVALKVLPFAGAMDPKQIQRFKNEAKAAASLKHDHIVSVHAIGCERGVHFYAMEFIDGQTLAQFIHGLRPDEQRPQTNGDTQDYQPAPAQAPSKPIAVLSTEKGSRRDRAFYRWVAELMAEAADALEHAHSLGIVHRDVKPGNLLLDTAGQVYVSDFGLARLANPGREAGGELTISGDLLGTLRYMAPEQALARHGLVDHRADVYGLGCTLYELLTGRPAVAGTDRADILRAIAFEEPTPLRKLDKSIPAELETITLKCLAKNPTERYASARELADDLRHWLTDKPIVAKAPGWREKITRWGRRHVAVVWGTAAVLATGLLLLSVSSLALWQKEKRVRNANRLAQANLSRALRALDEIHLRIVDNYTTKPKLGPKDRQLLDNILAFYEGFAAENAGEPSVDLETAKAYLRIGRIQFDLGRLAEAEAALRRSVERSKPLIEMSPASSSAIDVHSAALLQLGHTIRPMPLRASEAAHQYRECARICRLQATGDISTTAQLQWRAAVSLSALGTVLTASSDLQDASLVHKDAVRLARTLIAQTPDDPVAKRTLGHVLSNQAQAFNDLKDFDKSHAASQEAIQHLEALFHRDPNHDVRNLLANAHCVHATCLEAHGDIKKAEQAWEQAASLFPRLIAEFPGFAEHRAKLARTLGRMSSIQILMGSEDKAEKTTEREIAILEGLVAELPGVADYRFLLAESVASLGVQKLSHDNSVDAEALLTRAVTLFRALAEEHPTYEPYLRQWAQCSSYLGEAMTQNNKPEAESYLRQAVAMGRKLATGKPPESELGGLLLDALTALGVSLVGWDRSSEAEPILREVMQGRRLAVAKSPKNLLGSQDLAGTLGALAECVYCQGRTREAIELLEEAIPRAQTSASQLSFFSQARNMSAAAEAQLAWVLCNAAEEQLRNIPRAMELATHAVSVDPTSAPTHFRLGAALYRSGKPTEAIAAIHKGFHLSKRALEPAEYETAWLFLSMAYSKNGERFRPIVYYLAASSWIKENRPNDVQLRFLLDETATTIGIKRTQGVNQVPSN